MSESNGHAMGRVRHIHFVGVGGAGMSGIAEVLHNLGYQISGSDIRESGTTRHLRDLGIHVNTEHKVSHINGSDVVVISTAVDENNPELIAAREKRIPVVRRAEMLAELMRFRQGIAIAGTHGKTTTTSLVASVLAQAGLDPTFVIGGVLNSSGSNARLGSGEYLVAEADESDASFLHLQPVMAVLTNIDRDHLDTYGGDFSNLKNNFLEFLHRLPFYGLVVLCIDDENIQSLLPDLTRSFVSYGFSDEADYQAQDLRHHQGRVSFKVLRQTRNDSLNIELNMPGSHNVQNSLAAIALASELNVPDEAIISALSEFHGIGRRCDVKGQLEVGNKKVLLIDDYAHHPEEIKAILEAIEDGWPHRRVVGVFQPHRYSRTRDLFDEFSEILSRFDVLFLLDVYPAGEEAITGADSAQLSRAIRMRRSIDLVHVNDHESLFPMLENVLTDEDILLMLGAGDINNLTRDIYEQYGGKIH